jgi:hypothetical protein
MIGSLSAFTYDVRCRIGAAALAIAALPMSPAPCLAASGAPDMRSAALEVRPTERNDQPRSTIGATPPGEAPDDRVLPRLDHSTLRIHPAEPPKNFEITLALKPATAGGQAGIALRLLTPRDYYLVELDTAANTVAFDRVGGGEVAQIAQVEADIAVDTWHALQIRAEDERFTVSLDGKWLFTAYDTTLSRAGRIALWSKDGSAVRFDRIVILPLAESTQR